MKDAKQPEDFLRTLWLHYEQHGRHDLPWRQPERDGSFDPYKILVSEMMLQQTQVPRVILKYQSFLRTFPSAKVLAAADLSAVLAAWQGLGYNRRAKYLWEAAKAVETAGRFPKNLKDLVALPGIGANTAGAIMAYAYNQPVGFVETNIRTVYIHHFTRDGQIVSDDFIRDVVMATIDQANPRDFYWALMDYGSYLKTTIRNNHQSRHYRKQSPFDGSRRQVRGQVLRLLQPQPLGRTTLQAHISDARLDEVLAALVREGLVSYKDEKYRLGYWYNSCIWNLPRKLNQSSRPKWSMSCRRNQMRPAKRAKLLRRQPPQLKAYQRQPSSSSLRPNNRPNQSKRITPHSYRLR